eukprot:m.235370 g.235370  ORF g.235370 m.235370 type:complete len:152 (-) comp12812_c0_seq1:35-490(-)
MACPHPTCGTGVCRHCRAARYRAYLEASNAANDALPHKISDEVLSCCDHYCPNVDMGGGIVMRMRSFVNVGVVCAPISIPCVVYLKCADCIQARDNQPQARQEVDPLLVQQPRAAAHLYDCSVQVLQSIECCYYWCLAMTGSNMATFTTPE